jgi:hypothetical protein
MDDSDEVFGDSAVRWLVAGLTVALLAVILLVSVALAPLALAIDAGGGVACARTAATPTTLAATPTATAAGEAQPSAAPACLAGGPAAEAIVVVALAMAAHLHGNPDVWYDAGFPPAALAYWAHTCPGCAEWRNGNLQCVMFVLASYGVAGVHPPAAGNAVAFWTLYAHRPGWLEVPAGAAPPGRRGLPLPGDMMVWYSVLEPAVGHIAIVVHVVPPRGPLAGAVTFAEANGPSPIVTAPLLPDLSVSTWSHYTVLGYIRPA